MRKAQLHLGSLQADARLLQHPLPGHSEKLAGGGFPFGRAVLSLTPSSWLLASGQPRRRASRTPPTLLHPSLTAGRSRLTRRRAAAPSRRRVPRKATQLQRGWQRGSEKSPGWGRQLRAVFIVQRCEWLGNARAHTSTHIPTHTHTHSHTLPRTRGTGWARGGRRRVT